MSSCLAAEAALPRIAELLALTLRAEAGSQPVRAIEALAALVVNRARLAAADAAARLRFAPGAPPLPWPLLLARVCRAPFQFPCWHPRHARHAALAAPPDAALLVCRRIAARALAGTLPDASQGATHWPRGDALPAWAIGRLPTADLGGPAFYRLER